MKQKKMSFYCFSVHQIEIYFLPSKIKNSKNSNGRYIIYSSVHKFYKYLLVLKTF